MRTVWPDRSTSAGICGMVVVSCLREKGNGPSEWNVKVFLLAKQNVTDAMSDMYEEAGVVGMGKQDPIDGSRWL